jgi:hypothetical protein
VPGVTAPGALKGAARAIPPNGRDDAGCVRVRCSLAYLWCCENRQMARCNLHTISAVPRGVEKPHIIQEWVADGIEGAERH